MKTAKITWKDYLIKPTISIIIVHYYVEEAIFASLEALYTSKITTPYEVIVIDNGSDSGFEKLLKKKFPTVIYRKTEKNVGFGAANNIGAKIARGRYFFFLNPDTIIDPGSLAILYSYLEKNKSAAIAAPLLYHPTGELFKHQGVKLLTPVRALFSTSILHRFFPHNSISNNYWMEGWNKKKNREVDIVPGTAFMIREEVFKQARCFDEKFFLYFEEFDLCRTVKQLGWISVMVAGTKVVHFWGISTKTRDDINEIFTSSQEYYFRKQYGVILSKILSLLLTFNKYSFLLLVTLAIGLFLRIYRINELFMLIGDFGWFYLSALDMITTGIIPLVSIPSSVVWLHQGPLATYLIAFSLWISRLNPIAPALFFSLLDVVTIYFVFLLGKKIANSNVGVGAALLYATSPLVLITVRMPYHTSPIPFFVTSVMVLTITVLQKNKYFFWLFLFTGLLLQLELSNAIILGIFLILFLTYRNKIILLGILPFILYDVTHHFIQTLGFPLWVINRIRLFLGLTTSGNATTGNVPSVLLSIWEHIARELFPFSEIIVMILMTLSIIAIGITYLRNRKTTFQNKPFVLLLLWLIVPLLSFIIHTAPGDAYFPFLFPAFVLVVAYGIGVLSKNRLSRLLIITAFISLLNAYYTLSQDYFLYSQSGIHTLSPGGYSFGPAFSFQEDVASAIAKDTPKNPITVAVGGGLKTFKTGGDQFRYLLRAKGIKITPNSKNIYTIKGSSFLSK
jgi:GT2 family glycosyltransferase